ncbi:hypothetical protein F7P69_22685 [Cellulosimicrobium funkei]|nr:hypothetical protein [Cellulosimicrobium funkei]
MNVLTLEPQNPEFVSREFASHSPRRRSVEASRLDIVIDGRPLRSWIEEWHQMSWPTYVTTLTPSSRRWGLRQLAQLRGPEPELEPQRIELLYCPECFDVSDGILTIEASRTAEAVAWRTFSWKNDVGEADDDSEDLVVEGAPNLVFDTIAYDSAIDRAEAYLRQRLPFGWSRRR